MKSPLPSLISASVVAVCMLIAFTLWYLFIEKGRTHVADLESRIQQKTEHAAYISAARASLTEIQGEETAMQNYFVSNAEVVPFINLLQSEGRAIGTTVSVGALSTAVVKNHPVISLSLNITGSFDAVMRTVGAIEFAPYDITLGTVSLSRSEKGEWQATAALQVGSVTEPVQSTKP